MTDQNRRHDRDADYLFADLIAAEQQHFWFRTRLDLILWVLDSYVPDAQSFLEIGCGAGFVLQGIHHRRPGLRLTACDPSQEAIQHARTRVGSACFFRADVIRLPVSATFDVIMALDVLEHVREDALALDQIYDRLRPGGTLLLTVPQHPWLWSRVDEFSCHYRRYRRRDLVGKMVTAGFEILRCTSLFTATLPLAFLARRRHQADQAFDPAAELRLSTGLNSVLGALLKPEVRLLKAGFSLPAGSSLMVVARRPIP